MTRAPSKPDQPILQTASNDSDPQPPIIRRLGVRLGHLYQWALAAGPFDDIWDLCCDHGRLGLHLHQALRAQPSRPRVHLVDQAPQSIAELKVRYSHLLNEDLSIAQMDAANIILPNQGRQLLLLAGVGGATIASILARIVERLLEERTQLVADIEFMLSPNLKTFDLRRFLQANNFELLAEEFISEKGWSHEHIHVRYRMGGCTLPRVTLTSPNMWQPMTPEKERYLKKQLNHYHNRVRLGGHRDAQQAVDAYAGLLQTPAQPQND